MRDLLPETWSTCTVADLGDVITGSTPSTTRIDFYGGEVPFVRPPELLESTINTTADSLTLLGTENGRTVPSGAVLVGCIGNLGKVGLATDTVAFNQQINAVVPTKTEFSKWFFYVVQSAKFREQMMAASSATTVTILNKGNFSKLEVPVAPLTEQQRIVDAIESYFTRLDDTVAALERVQRNLKRYRASVLKAAVEGRLVPTEAELARAENRDYEPASELLARILDERRRLWEEAELAKMMAKSKPPKNDEWKAKYTEPVAPYIADLPELPEGWCWASVEQLGFVASGQTPKGVTTAGSQTGDVPWFRVGDMNTEGNETHMRVVVDWLTHEQVADFGLHVRPPGTIIFPKRGGAIKTNKKRLLAMPSSYDLNTMGIVPVPPIGSYLWMWFTGLSLGPLADGSNVPQLNHGDIAPLPVPLPPLPEQHRVVEEVERMLSIQEAATLIVTENARRANHLRQTILKWAFEGKLADQDPSDEPASVLLERIQAERDNATKKKSNGGRRKETKDNT